jgi:hypothetical protein
MIESKSLLRFAANVGYDQPIGRRANTLAYLIQVEPEHDNHARRQIEIAYRLTGEFGERMARRALPATPGSPR